MPHDIKLILTDIDGTIMPAGQRVINERCRSAFHAAMDAGMRVGPASGRGIAHVRPLFRDDDMCVLTAIATNGMQVYLDGELIHETTLDLGELAKVEAVVRDTPGAGLLYFDGSTPCLVVGTADDLRRSFPAYADIAREVGHLPERAPVKVNPFCAVDREETQRLFDRLSREVPGLGFNLPMPGFVNIVPVGWSKASAVDLLCERMGITIEQACVFGDSGNDLEMLAHVPCSVAVAGATPEAASAAHYHIGRCEDDAVPEAIERLAAGEFPFAS